MKRSAIRSKRSRFGSASCDKGVIPVLRNPERLASASHSLWVSAFETDIDFSVSFRARSVSGPVTRVLVRHASITTKRDPGERMRAVSRSARSGSVAWQKLSIEYAPEKYASGTSSFWKSPSIAVAFDRPASLRREPDTCLTARSTPMKVASGR